MCVSARREGGAIGARNIRLASQASLSQVARLVHTLVLKGRAFTLEQQLQDRRR